MTPHDSLLCRGAQAFGFTGQLVKLDLPAGRVAVAVEIDEEEHARRTETGLGAITDRELVTALWELPHSLHIPEAAIPAWAVDSLRRAPVSVVASDGMSLSRQSRPPLSVSGALAVGQKLERLLQRVGQLSAIASMAIIVQNDVDADDPWMLNAALFGVGVARCKRGVLTPVSDPGTVIPTLGPYLWWVTELAYEQLTGCSKEVLPTP